MYKLQQYTSCVLLRLPLQFNYYLIDIRSPSYQDYNIFLQISQCHLRSWYVFCVIGMFGAFSAQKMRYGLARNHSAFQHIFR